MSPKKNGLEVKLPIFANKVIENVEQLTEPAFKKNWDDITFKRPDFHKMDTILKNPAPAHVPVGQVLAQVANFFQGSLNLKVFRPTANKVQGAGQAHFKPATQESFPSNPNEMKPSVTVPLMIEAQFYEEDTS